MEQPKRWEQILMHLYNFPEKGNGYDMPFETTQDGIAECVGISRGHASLELKRMTSKHLITFDMRHPKHDGQTGRLRRCYNLNNDGREMARSVIEKYNGFGRE